MSLAQLLDEAAIDRELVRRGGLRSFMRMAWPQVEPADPLLWNWHHDAKCEHIQAVIEHQIRNLIICEPPGFTKSLTVSVMGSAYAWTTNPAYRILALSNKDPLARRDSRKVRSLVLGQWYQERWGDRFRLTKTDDSRLENNKSGFRITGSTTTGVTGERGNLVLVDDPMSREMAESEAHRATVNEFIEETLPTRVNDFKRDGKVFIMQRLHADDPVGRALKRAPENWEVLVLPNEYEPKTVLYVKRDGTEVQAKDHETALGFKDPRTTDGELLHEERVDAATTAELKDPGEGIGSYAYAGQYQQRPAPRGGGLIKEEYLKHRYQEKGTDPMAIVQSWDCASKPKEHNDPSVCLTFAVFVNRVEVWDASVKRQEFPGLMRRAKDQHAAHKPSTILIEDKDAGQQLLQMLRAADDGNYPVQGMEPGGLDKFTRMSTEVTFLEAGRLWLPAHAPWVKAYVDELTIFPGGSNDDQVDATSQFLKWYRQRFSSQRASGIVAVGRSSPNKAE